MYCIDSQHITNLTKNRLACLATQADMCNSVPVCYFKYSPGLIGKICKFFHTCADSASKLFSHTVKEPGDEATVASAWCMYM